ncbi:hypothetical protein FACS1894159_11020 [Bacteroidia bacterium]|nr:hypothetical protein FACS1894159_11020 [Bacteroidia bacterium]
MRRTTIIPTAALIALVATACSPKVLYTWTGYDNAVYAYTKAPDEANTAQLIKIYTRLIDNPGGLRLAPPPGVCADYGYLLIRAGKTVEGKALLNKEIQLYPESKPFIDRILKRFDQ